MKESDRRSDAPSRRKHMFARTWRETTGNLIDRSFSITRRKREKRWNSWRELERDADEEQEGRSRHSRRRNEETLTNDNGRCNSSPSVTSVKSDRQPDRQREKASSLLIAPRHSSPREDLRDTLYAAPDARTRGHPAAATTVGGGGRGGNASMRRVNSANLFRSRVG